MVLMEMLGNLLIFLVGSGFMWISSALIIEGVENFSKNVRANSFVVSFVMLGILTSVTEISVGVNAIILKKPEIFAGNLIGSSFVIVLFIIPLLAVLNKGIHFRRHFKLDKLFFFLILLIAPAFMALDGTVSQFDALLLLLLYLFFFSFFNHNRIKLSREIQIQKIESKKVFSNIAKILAGAALIFFASQILVDKTIYFATIFHAPPFIASLFILAIGTNLPELAIAVNSTYRGKTEIALGDYIGSAAANVMLFSVFSLIYGTFSIDTNHFYLMMMVVVTGFILFFFFSKSKNTLSLFEGIILLLVYFVYLFLQISDIFVI